VLSVVAFGVPAADGGIVADGCRSAGEGLADGEADAYVVVGPTSDDEEAVNNAEAVGSEIGGLDAGLLALGAAALLALALAEALQLGDIKGPRLTRRMRWFQVSAISSEPSSG